VAAANLMGRARGWEIVERAKAGERLVFDGGYGTALFAAGLSNGACPELWNDTHPDIVRGIHKGYFDAGSDFVETNTRRHPAQAERISDRRPDKGAELEGGSAGRVRVLARPVHRGLDRPHQPPARRVRSRSATRAMRSTSLP